MKNRYTRRGFTLLEISVSAVIIGVMATILTQGLTWRNAQQRSSEWRAVALIEAGNLLDRATALSYGDIDQSALDALTLSQNLQQRKPAASLRWLLEPVADEPQGKRITVEIQLPGKQGADSPPVRLTAWVYGKQLGTRNAASGELSRVELGKSE